MATAENPFPQTQKKKKGMIYGSSEPKETPLYYEDTVKAFQAQLGDEMAFAHESNGSDQEQSSRNSSRRSGLTGASTSTFRDT
jgi:hypothetical protein